MKKLLSFVLALTLVLSFAGCGDKESEQSSETQQSEDAAIQDSDADDSEDAADQNSDADDSEDAADQDSNAEVKPDGVMTYAEYAAAELNSEVVIEAYVQAKQSWWENQATVYAQDEDGAYFLYNMACSEDDYAKLVPGTKIKVTGYKSEWSGEVEITDATFEIEDGSYIASANDVTALLGTDELIDHQNEFVSFKGMTVEAADESGAAFLYNYDGSGSADSNSDLYFNVSLNGETYTFTVESYLCDNTTDVYKTVEGLNVGDVIDMEGFLYWYNGVNPHITSVTVK